MVATWATLREKAGMEYRDYYQILGVAKTADQDAIKKAYRKLARQNHPDVNPGDKQAEERFKDINEAYEVLSDPEKRQKYDQFGAQWQQYERAGGRPDDFWQQWGGAAQGGPGRQGYTRTVSPEEFEQIFGQGGDSGFSSFFETLFGGGMGGQRPSGFGAGSPYGDPRPRRGRDMEHPVEITLEEAFQGTSRLLQREDGRQSEVKIPRGAKTGTRVRLAGEGSTGAAGGEAGDLYLRVEVLPHNRFERDGDDLKVTVPVDLYTAILGGRVEVPTLAGPVKLTIPAETANGRVFRLRGQGMPQLRTPDQRGDLYATIEVQLPRGLNDEERQLFEQLKAMRPS
jgi:curved DNA-binding protein